MIIITFMAYPTTSKSTNIVAPEKVSIYLNAQKKYILFQEPCLLCTRLLVRHDNRMLSKETAIITLKNNKKFK